MAVLDPLSKTPKCKTPKPIRSASTVSTNRTSTHGPRGYSNTDAPFNLAYPRLARPRLVLCGSCQLPRGVALVKCEYNVALLVV
ncbi:hypothetical protein IF2G_08962 [Cordyceps javanica]|nr:hypothetical protein IF2G_08962 [Cordyceps javanica]